MDSRIRDGLAIVFLFAVTAAYGYFFVNFRLPPLEDAAMLMRYIDHFSQGHGIVWNIGDAPVDGGTDFLFIMVAGLLHFAGLSLETSVRSLTVLAHFGTVGLIYFAMRKVLHAGPVPGMVSALYFALGPGLFIAAAYFATPFFALAVTATWVLALRIILSQRRALFDFAIFSVVALITGLIRPEGVLMVTFILIAICVMVPFKPACRLVTVFCLVFLVFGGSYLIWRWSYFGHVLPNPFYVKGQVHRHMKSLHYAVGHTLKLCFPLVFVLTLALRKRTTLVLAGAFAVPILGSTLMWMLVTHDTNFAGRFQYPILPIAVLSWYPLVRDVRDDLKLPALRELSFPSRLAAVATIVLVVVGILGLQVLRCKRLPYFDDGRYSVGLILSPYAAKGYTIATTEAGLLPLYSRWRAIDTYGLNDAWIAQHGAITPDYLRRANPEIIMWHGYFSPLVEFPPEARGRWSNMVRTLKTYVEQNNYILAAVFGTSPFDTHYYYVRPDFPESREIIEGIRSQPYAWFEDGRICLDFAKDHPHGK